MYPSGFSDTAKIELTLPSTACAISITIEYHHMTNRFMVQEGIYVNEQTGRYDTSSYYKASLTKTFNFKYLKSFI